MAWPFTGEDGLIEKVYLKGYRERSGEDSENWLKVLLTSSISRMAFLSAYKDLPPIEQMPEKEKEEMKQYVHGLMQGKSVEEKVIACKIIYTIGTLV